MSDKRHHVVKGFQRCGIYLLKNGIRNEWILWQLAEPSSNIEQRSSPIVAEKLVFPSPSKEISNVHKRPHTTHLTSLKNITAKKMKAACQNQTKPKSPNESARKSTRLPTWMVHTNSVQQSTSAISGPSADVQVKASVKTKPNKVSSYNSCGQAWKQNMLDFFKCVICAKWCCEDCFEVERCIDCL